MWLKRQFESMVPGKLGGFEPVGDNLFIPLAISGSRELWGATA